MKLTVSLASLELGWQKLTSVTNCGERNMIISKIGLVWQIYETITYMNSDNPMVFCNFTYQDVSCCIIFHRIWWNIWPLWTTIDAADWIIFIFNILCEKLDHNRMVFNDVHQLHGWLQVQR